MLRACTGQHPRIPSYKTLHARFGGYRAALTAARITDREIVAARARRFPAAQAVGPTPAARLAGLAPETIAELGVGAEEIERLTHRGFAELPLDRAVAIARALDGSLDWLAGRVEQQGTAPHPAVTLDSAKLRQGMRAVALSHEEARLHLGLALGPWRRMLNATDTPALALLAALAELVQVQVADIVG